MAELAAEDRKHIAAVIGNRPPVYSGYIIPYVRAEVVALTYGPVYVDQLVLYFDTDDYDSVDVYAYPAHDCTIGAHRVVARRYAVFVYVRSQPSKYERVRDRLVVTIADNDSDNLSNSDPDKSNPDNLNSSDIEMRRSRNAWIRELSRLMREFGPDEDYDNEGDVIKSAVVRTIWQAAVFDPFAVAPYLHVTNDDPIEIETTRFAPSAWWWPHAVIIRGDTFAAAFARREREEFARRGNTTAPRHDVFEVEPDDITPALAARIREIMHERFGRKIKNKTGVYLTNPVSWL